MKRIVGGRRYDTEGEGTERIAEWDNGHFSTDFEYCEEALYRTAKGTYFIAGSGGPKSTYSQPCGSNSISGGSGIEPVTEDEAYDWLEQKGLTEAIEEHFADRVENA